MSLTKILPSLSAATVFGGLNWTSPVPPNFIKNLPVGSNFWIRLFFVSATIMLPSLSTATPCGELSSPSPEPKVPNLSSNLPDKSNF